MKLIISRKGFDDTYGGGASPILPEGRMVSMPIPEPGQRGYDTIRNGNLTLRDVRVEHSVRTASHITGRLRAAARLATSRPVTGSPGRARRARCVRCAIVLAACVMADEPVINDIELTNRVMSMNSDFWACGI